MAVHTFKETVEFDKSINVEFAILDIPKIIMYNFSYNIIKKLTVKKYNCYIQVQIH